MFLSQDKIIFPSQVKKTFPSHKKMFLVQTTYPNNNFIKKRAQYNKENIHSNKTNRIVKRNIKVAKRTRTSILLYKSLKWSAMQYSTEET